MEDPQITEISPRRAQTRQRLLDAAFHVLAREGLAGASIEAIVAEAGFTRGAFYSNFETKEEIFSAVVDREMRKRLDAVAQAARQLEHAELSMPLSAEMMAGLLGNVIVDPETEREWQIIMTEIELNSLRNPGGAIGLPEPDLAYIDDVAQALLPALRRMGVELSGDPQVTLRLLVNGYLAVARQALRSEVSPAPSGADIPPQLEWFTVLVERFLQPES